GKRSRTQQAYGIVVHTSGAHFADIAAHSPADRATLNCRTAAECALGFYARAETFPHYLIDYEGVIYSICPENYIAYHVGWPGGKPFWRGFVAPLWWARVWGKNKTPADLLPPDAWGPNSCYFGIELLGALADAPYTDAQFMSLARLIA